MSNPVLGIDFGTGQCSAAAVVDGEIHLVVDSAGDVSQASLVSLLVSDGAFVTGNEALKTLSNQSAISLPGVRRLLGQFDTSAGVAKLKHSLPCGFSTGTAGELRLDLGEETLPLPLVAGMSLNYLKTLAELQIGSEIPQVVIAVPGACNINQRQSTIDAAFLAGFEHVRLITAPLATAWAQTEATTNETVAVIDIGAGHFDGAVITIDGQVLAVQGTATDALLGGADFDKVLLDHVIASIRDDFGFEIRQTAGAKTRLATVIQSAKHNLSTSELTTIILARGSDERGPIQLDLTRAKFNDVCGDLLERIERHCDDLLDSVNLPAHEIDRVFVRGGMTAMPAVKHRLSRVLHRDIATCETIEHAVAIGAARMAEGLWANPITRRVAVELNPLTLRLGTAGGYTVPVIPQNAPLPYEHSRTLTIANTKHDAFVLKVFQGESRRQEDNQLLGEFEFSGFTDNEHVRPELTVTLQLTSDGLLNIIAASGTGNVTQQAIKTTRLSDEQIRFLIEEHPIYTLSDGSGVLS